MPVVEISNGELLDRISILRIKDERIEDPSQREHIARELSHLEAQGEQLLGEEQVAAEFARLHEANRLMWDAMQEVYDWQGPYSDALNQTIMQVVKVNMDRAHAKARIDTITESNLREAKSFFN